MTRERRRRSAARRQAADTVPQLPWRHVENPCRLMEVLRPARGAPTTRHLDTYHSTLTLTDRVFMRTGASAFGTPENAKANIASGQLARRYGLPYRTTNANASNVVDAQAAYETEMSLWGAVMGGANLIHHAAGWLEGGLTASFEKVILDTELLQSMAETLTPLAVDDASFGFDATEEVGPGGHFFGMAHTMERYRTAIYEPILSDWQNREAWEAEGSRDTTQRAIGVWQQLLAQYEEPEMGAAVREELDAYVARRRQRIDTEGAGSE